MGSRWRACSGGVECKLGMVEHQFSSSFLDEFQGLEDTCKGTCKERVAVIKAGDDCRLDEQLGRLLREKEPYFHDVVKLESGGTCCGCDVVRE